LTHPIIMKLTWRQFECYMDAFTYLLREEGGKDEENRQDDAAFVVENGVDDAEKQEIADLKARAAKYAGREKVKSQGAKKKLL